MVQFCDDSVGHWTNGVQGNAIPIAGERVDLRCSTSA